MEKLTLTEIEELRIAIAEEMGWAVEHYEDDGFEKVQVKSPCGKTWTTTPPFITSAFDSLSLPPYTTSIDSIREAAMERFKDNRWDFENHLLDLADEIKEWDTPLWQLTALDWAIAFARTAKIWRYKV